MADVDGEIQTEIVLVGSGVAGIGTGIALSKAGFTEFVILERAQEIGGTWRDHTYPGLTVDIPSLIYSFSYEPKPDWSSMWAPQSEVLDYCRHCVDRYGLAEHVRFGAEVESAEFALARDRWVVRCRDGRVFVARYLINGSGYLGVPKLPEVDGLESFTGTVVHSCEWSQAPDLTGKLHLRRPATAALRPIRSAPAERAAQGPVVRAVLRRTRPGAEPVRSVLIRTSRTRRPSRRV